MLAVPMAIGTKRGNIVMFRWVQVEVEEVVAAVKAESEAWSGRHSPASPLTRPQSTVATPPHMTAGRRRKEEVMVSWPDC